VLSAHGHHDLAVRLFQSREFPSWGYEVVNGATTIWERWDSYTKKDAFSRHNAAMNSFSHYAFGAVCGWMFQDLCGIDTEEPGFGKIRIQPGPPHPGSNPDREPIHWVKARYDSVRGPIRCDWRLRDGRFELDVTLPPNTSGTVVIPSAEGTKVTEGGRPIEDHPSVDVVGAEGDRRLVRVSSGRYAFRSTWP
jgi:alpha-L-rhamnosidase